MHYGFSATGGLKVSDTNWHSGLSGSARSLELMQRLGVMPTTQNNHPIGPFPSVAQLQSWVSGRNLPQERLLRSFQKKISETDQADHVLDILG